MFPQLNEILEINVNSLESGQCIFINERGSVDGSYILHHFISLFLKNGHKVCLSSLYQSFTHFNNVGIKLGLNLSLEKDKNNLYIIEGLKCIGKEILQTVSLSKQTGGDVKDNLINFENKKASLNVFYKFIKETLEKIPDDQHVAIILDDISVLCYLGIPVMDIICFIKYLQNLCVLKMDRKVSLVILGHSEGDLDQDMHAISNYLHHHSHISLSTESLQSGSFKTVDGQLTAVWRNLTTGSKEKEKVMHYKIKDKSVDFYPLGMSSAVL